MTSRYSTPPDAAKLEESTRNLEASLDHLARSVAIVTDEQRLVVFRELVAYQYLGKFTHLDQALYAFEREIKARMGAGR